MDGAKHVQVMEYLRLKCISYRMCMCLACLVLFGINSMDTVDVKPAEILGKVILWPVALMEAVVRYSSTHHNIKTAL